MRGRRRREGQQGQSRGSKALVCLALTLALAGDARAGSTVEEYSVKAAFLFHFAQFIEWPPGAFKNPGAPLTYCTVGEDPFRGALEATLNGKTIGIRGLRVAHFKQVEEVRDCQVVFLGGLGKKTVPEALAALADRPVLTVGETQQFAQDGGMIGFRLEENKVRFEINLAATERAGLKISAQLLALASKVIGGPKGS